MERKSPAFGERRTCISIGSSNDYDTVIVYGGG